MRLGSVFLLSGVLGALLSSSPARAASGDPCPNLTGRDNAVPKVHLGGGDTQEFMLKRLGKFLLQSSTKLRIIYRNRPTCELRSSLFSNAQMLTIATPTARPVRYIPDNPNFDPAKDAAPTCTVPDAAPG